MKTKGKKSHVSKTIKGLSDLFEHQELEKYKNYANAKELFLMVTDQRGSNAKLRSLVTHETLLELIKLTIDIGKKTRASYNQVKSRHSIKNKREIAVDKLRHWLKINLVNYRGRLDDCAEDAIVQIRGLGRGHSWIQKEISDYRKKLKLADC